MTQHEETIVVDGVEYRWLYRHGYLITSPGLKGVSVCVSLEPGRTRELILDFPFDVFGLEKRPAIATLAPAIASGIRAARAAGWAPASRGKTFRFEVPPQQLPVS